MIAAPLKFHPLAEVFPLIKGRDFFALVEDIERHGLREPVVLYQGQILDGRNRYRACQVAGADCRFEVYEGTDPTAYVVSLNLRRRHLDESQRALVAAKLATLRRGDNQHSPIGETSQAEAAALLNVGKRSVERAREVLDEGTAELIRAVERGDVSVTAAADVATMPQAEQRDIVARGEREILEVAKAIRARKVLAKRAAVLAEQAHLYEKNAALPVGERKYAAIYADCPWAYEVYSETGTQYAASNHYPTMSIDDIAALPVGDLAADDCALFMWATMPHLPEVLRVISAWGFTYKTCAFCWVKQNPSGDGLHWGLGYWTRANAELCLLATRGNPFRLNMDVHSVVLTPVMEHSRKPEEVAERIERLVPGPYIELFARRPREKWDVWGNEAPSDTGAAE